MHLLMTLTHQAIGTAIPLDAETFAHLRSLHEGRNPIECKHASAAEEQAIGVEYARVLLRWELVETLRCASVEEAGTAPCAHLCSTPMVSTSGNPWCMDVSYADGKATATDAAAETILPLTHFQRM